MSGSMLCRGGGIRTPGTLRFNGFQDRRIRPLCHSSVRSKRIIFRSAKVIDNSYLPKELHKNALLLAEIREGLF